MVFQLGALSFFFLNLFIDGSFQVHSCLDIFINLLIFTFFFWCVEMHLNFNLYHVKIKNEQKKYIIYA